MKSTSPTTLQKLGRFRFPINCALIALTAFWQVTQPLQAAAFYWDADGSDAGNNALTGANLGGAGAWNTSNSFWWDLSSFSTWPASGANEAIFTGAYPALGIPVKNLITLDSGITANKLTFVRSGYDLTSGDLTLAGADSGLHINFGESATINSTLLGTDGLLVTGGGSVRLGGGSYTGVTNIAGGSVIISSGSALGASTSAVNITGGNAAPSNTSTIGFVGGSLILDGFASGFDFSRDLNLEGRGPNGSNGAAVLSMGNNTLSGVVTTSFSAQSPATFRNTRLTSANGTLTLSGTLNALGVAGTTVTTLGGANQSGSANYSLTGILTGSGTLEKSGGGTLFLEPSDSSGFTGRLRVSGSAASGQSSVRISSIDVLGTANSTTTSAPLDLNGGILEILSDTSLNFAKNVYQRASSTIFVGPSIGGTGINGTAAFASMAFEDNLTNTFNGRSGYGISFTTAPVVGTTAGDNNSTITNNMGGLLSFTGNFWSNANNTGSRTLTIGGNGNTLINGNLIASATSFDHILAKSGAGSLTITGTASTLDGAVSITGGAVVVTDFRSITNNTSAVNLNGGTLIVGTSTAPTALGLTTSKVMNLSGTSGAATIYADQSGINPVVLNANFTASGNGTKTLTLGGGNTSDNVINGAIVQNGSTLLSKVGSGTWVLAGANTFTGATTISNGTLKLKANAAASTVLPSTNAITFSSNNVYAGGTLELVGQNGVNNVQNLGALAYATAGSNTIKLTPGVGGSASLIFANISTGGSGTLNIVGADFTNNKVTLTQVNAAAGADGILTRSVYWNGADFAYRQGGVLRAPVYGVDVGTSTSSTALTTANTNEITGSFSANTISIANLKIAGSQVLTLNGGQTLTLSAGGLLGTGGASSITGGTALALGSNILVARVNLPTDSLTIDTAITGTGGFTKSGAGTLILSGANNQSGTVTINEGIVQLSGSGRLGASADLTIRQGATLDLNGVTPSTVTNAFNSNGTVTNSSATPVTFTVGGTTSTGTSFGIINETNGVINITKSGTGAQSWLGASNYTGVTNIGGTALVTVDYLADGGVASGIGASTNAASNLVFSGTAATSGLSYRGDIVNGNLTLGSRSASTDRLFTVSGSGVTIGSSQTTNVNNSILWLNTGAIVHGTDADREFIFTGSSQGDNTFIPQLTDATGFISKVTKNGTGIWKLGGANNTYSGNTTITQGILRATDGEGLSPNSNLVFDGGTFYSQGTLTRNIGTAGGEMRFQTPAANTAQFSGGFLGGDSKLTVTWTGNPEWGTTSGFIPTRDGLMLNGSQARGQGATGSIALSEVDIASDFSLGVASGAALGPALSYTLAQNSATVTLASTAGISVGQSITGTNVPSGAYVVSVLSATQIQMSANTANTSGISGSYTDGAVTGGNLRAIRVDDNGNTGADFATISGVISAGNALTGIRKLGTGILKLSGANTYEGETNVNQGTLAVTSLGMSGSVGTSSVGAVTASAFNDSNALTLGNGGTGAGILQYVGLGELSDRKIRLNTTTGSTQIHADGVGPLILTNVANDMVAGAKTLFLRGTNAGGNMISSQLSDNGGTLAVTIDGNATWILSNSSNNYTGTTSVNGGALGIGHETAISAAISVSNGNIFAYGGDRTMANNLTLGNNAASGFLGDYNLTFTGTNNLAASANNVTLNNSIVSGKSLTLKGLIANSLTATRVWTVDGPGETVVDGNFTTSTAFGVQISKTGNGTLTLGGDGTVSNWNQVGTGIDVDRGILKFITDNAINSTAGYAGVTISPEVATLDSAIIDLNGTTQTINALTATTDGTTIIDNTSAAAATFRFGANNAAVSFGSGIGTYTVQNTGDGALSLVKLGNTTVSFITGITLAHKGLTASEGGGIFNIASPLTATTGLRAIEASSLALTGGISNPGLITGIEVGGGSILSLLDGAGSAINNLSTLSLGNTGTGTATLNLNIGDLNTITDRLNTDTLTLLTGGTLNLGNTVTFNMTDAGLNPGQTYTLLSVPDGGLATFGLGNFIQGATPGGFSSFTWDVQDTYVRITTGTLLTGDLYWRGLTNSTWNANANNWSDDKAGSTPAASIPGQGNNVFFAYNGIGTGALTTTLEQNFKINSLIFEAGTTTPASVTIDPGTVATSRLEISPQVSSGGISMTTGAPPIVNINTAVKLGADQTWNIVDGPAVLSLGSLLGEADVIKAGAGKVILTSAADPTFNAGQSSVFTVNAGNLEITNTAALGTSTNSNIASIVLNGGGYYYNNATTAGTALTLPHPITLAGGSLSGGGTNHTYGGAISVTAPSTINMADSNTAQTGTARNITLSGAVSGTASLTIDSNNTLSSGNQIGGTLTISSALSTWAGDLLVNRGTVTIAAAASPTFTPDDITFNSFGRLIYQGVDGQTINRSATLNLAAGAVGELQVDNTTATQAIDFVLNQNGVTNMGLGGTGASMRVVLPDTFAKMNITNDVILGGNSSISLSNSATRLLTISGVISDGGSAYALAVNDDAGGWAQTNGTVRLLGLNTFSGNLALGEGILEYDTVTDAGGAASSLGQGTAISMGAATLSFIGSASQATNRPITTTGSATLSANGTSGATITYNGAISQALDNQFTLTGTGEGFITGGITQVGVASDINVNSGTWTLSGSGYTLADDIIVTATSTGTAVLNLNTTGILNYTAGASNGLYARNGGMINLGANDVSGVSNSGGLDFINIADTTAGATAVLNTNGYNLTSPGLLVGNTPDGLVGSVTGSGTITLTNTTTDWSLGIRTYRGSISANLAGVSSFLKQGLGEVTVSGDNSGLTGTVAATRVDAGSLVLDYTTQNNNKISAVAALDMRGGTVTLNGYDAAATAQTVNGFTLANASGTSRLVLNPGAGQEVVLNMGTLTRGVNSQDGTLRIVLPSGTQSATNGVTTTTALTAGLVGSAAFLTVEDGTGTWFGTKSGNNIVALLSTPKNDVSTWLAGDHITDETTGFTGTYSSVGINSLRFDAAGGSTANLGSTGVLGLITGGLLITDNVAASSGITGGTLFSGAAAATPEVIVTHDSAFTHTISADIRVNHILFKTGTGTLRLTGNNVYTGLTEIQNGTLELSGGNAIGDNSLVTLSDDTPTTLKLLASETIGRLAGGNTTDGLRNIATVDIGGYTLTTNTIGGNTTYSGKIVGNGTIIKNGSGTNTNWNLNNISDGFTGSVVVNGGLFQLSNIGRIDASSFTINKSGTILIDNNSSTSSGTRILDAASITLNSTDGPSSGETRPSGVWIRRDQGSTQNETVGVINVNSGASYTRMEATTTNAIVTLIADNILRVNGATLDVRGTNMTATSGQRAQLRIGTAGNQTTFMNAMVGGGGILGTKNISIVPWAIAEETVSATAAVADGNMGNSLASYVTGVGFRALNFTTEYDTYAAATAQSNTRESLVTDLTGLTGKTINSLVLNNAATAAVAVTGTGGGQSLAVTSGALLFTVTGGVASTAYSTTLGGFDDGITVGSTNEYVIHVVNPSSATTTSTLTASITSKLISAADITKSGRGTLILSGINTAGGGARKTTINEGVLEIADLDNIGGDTGSLVFAGGVLRLGTGYADDVSIRTISYFNGGGSIDTNGNNPVFANSLGSGVGGFTKVGAGNLTLNATATYTGNSTLSVGTVTVGANNALGSGGNLTLAAGSTLAFSGTNSITHGLVSASGAAWAITGNGTINASAGFSLSTTDATQVDAVLAGNGGLFKSGSQVLTLTGLNTYTGTTEVQAGTLSIASISNVGGGASALGNPGNPENGIIRMGLTTAATTLTYTGDGDTSDRLIGMQGTTGGVTLNGNGTGAVSYGGARFEMAGNKTLTLGGTSDPALVNSIGELREVGGAMTLLKTDANTWNLTASNTYTGSTNVNNGLLRISAVQNLTGALNFGSTNAITTAGTVEVNEDAAFGQLLVQTNSAVNTNNLVIAAGKTLQINGNATIGSSVGAFSNTLLNASGDGTLNITNLASAAQFRVGGSSASGNVTLADMSGLASLNVSLNTTDGVIRVNSTTGTNVANAYSVLQLATDSTLAAATLAVGDGGQFGGGVDQVNQLLLGTGDTLINVNTINIGTGIRDLGEISFQDTTGTLIVRAADGTSATAFNMGTGSAITAVALNGNQNTFDVTGHDADLKFSTVNIGTQNRGADLANVFSFDTGTLEIGSLNASSKGANGFTTTTTINIGGGTVTTGAWTLASASGAGSAVATANLTGGDITFSGNISRGADAVGGGTATGTVNLDGATLDMSGNNIGTATDQIIFNAMSGTLIGLNELNGGGALTKTTTGTLVMGTNAYTGPTNVNDGTLQVGVAGVGTTGTGLVTVVKTGATYLDAPVVSGSGLIQGALVVGDISNAANRGILSPGDGTHDVNNATLTITASGGLTIAAGSQTLLGVTSATGTDASFAASGLTASAYLAGLSSTSDGVMGSAPSAWFAEPAAGELDFLNLTHTSGTLTLGTNGGTAAAGQGIVSIFSNGLNLGTLAAGQIFNLVDWYGAFSGSFSAGSTYSTGGVHGDFDLPDISTTGFSWDTSAFTSHGVLAVSAFVVPEPSRALLMLFGLLLLSLRRRRQSI